VLALAFGFVAMPCVFYARTRPATAKVDIEYISALATADVFLHAWQVQDQETGLLMLSDAAKGKMQEERLQAFFSPGDNAGYQISGGKKLKAGRYAFPVALFQTAAGGHERLRFSQIVVVKSGTKEWEVDQLP
jgi:hypothetical protein